MSNNDDDGLSAEEFTALNAGGAATTPIVAEEFPEIHGVTAEYASCVEANRHAEPIGLTADEYEELYALRAEADEDGWWF